MLLMVTAHYPRHQSGPWGEWSPAADAASLLPGGNLWCFRGRGLGAAVCRGTTQQAACRNRKTKTTITSFYRY